MKVETIIYNDCVIYNHLKFGGSPFEFIVVYYTPSDISVDLFKFSDVKLC